MSSMGGIGPRWAGQRGAGLVEIIVGLPVVLVFALVLVQLALLYQTRSMLDHALAEAAREGAVGNARESAIHAGLVRGMMPMTAKGTGPEDVAAAWVRARLQFESDRLQRMVILRQLSPFAESFDDWAEYEVLDDGQTGSRLVIPNDNLEGRRAAMKPFHGAEGMRGMEPIGMRSHQTLADANLLRLELTYGVPLRVPLAGRIIAQAVSVARGCSGFWRSSEVLAGIGALLGGEACAMLGRNRLPVVLSTTTRMMSPVERSALVTPMVGKPGQ